MFYFAHLDNFIGIIKDGILSRNEVFKKGFTDFSNPEVQNRRRYRPIYVNEKLTQHRLHDFVNLYWVTHTPTLYAKKDLQNSLFFLEIDYKRMRNQNKNRVVLFTDGNAASSGTRFFEPGIETQKNIPFEVLNAKYWSGFVDGTRKRNSEILIYEKIEPIYFNRVIVSNNKLFDHLKIILDKMNWKGLKDDFKLWIDPQAFF